jgi:exonuclease III
MGSENIFFWNVCGLNAPTYRNTLRSLVAAVRPSMVYLQETKNPFETASLHEIELSFKTTLPNTSNFSSSA